MDLQVQGWIKLHRQIRDNFVWIDKPFSKGQAWIDILLRVNHRPKKVPVGNQLVEVREGQTIWSILGMADSWGWSRKKVDNFLKLLEKEQMLHSERTTKYTLLTVANWDSYQEEEQQKSNKGTSKEHQTNIKRTSKEHQKSTNKNEKNYKNEKNDKNNIKNSLIEFVPKFNETSNEFRLTKFLVEWMIKNNRNAKIPKTPKQVDNWCSHIDKILRIDGYSVDEVRQVIQWSQKHEFWKGTILSTSKLRKQMGQLIVKMKGDTKNMSYRDRLHQNKDVINAFLNSEEVDIFG